MKRAPAGFSLVEVLLTSGLFLLLTLLLLAGWTQGSRAWRTGSERNEVLGQAQRFLRLTERELEATSSLAIDIHASEPILSYASAFTVDDPSKFEVEPHSGSLNWPKQVVVYLNRSDQTVRRRSLAVAPHHGAYRIPAPLSQIDVGSGVRPLSFYATGGEVAARRVSELSVSIHGQTVKISVLLKTEQGREANFESNTLLRNSQ